MKKERESIEELAEFLEDTETGGTFMGDGSGPGPGGDHDSGGSGTYD